MLGEFAVEQKVHRITVVSNLCSERKLLRNASPVRVNFLASSAGFLGANDLVSAAIKKLSKLDSRRGCR
jgi:hypothetical protein